MREEVRECLEEEEEEKGETIEVEEAHLDNRNLFLVLKRDGWEVDSEAQ